MLVGVRSVEGRQRFAGARLDGDCSEVVSGCGKQLVMGDEGMEENIDWKGNPLLKHIRNVRWNFAEVIPDYVLGQNSCALYLSLRYHLLHPDYLYFRIRELQKNFRLRVVLCHVDV
ncbi:hypothetical protein KSS87_021387, partial [Heliosperma pusillum]